jgi:lipoyl(octanoyl) transferase
MARAGDIDDARFDARTRDPPAQAQAVTIAPPPIAAADLAALLDAPASVDAATGFVLRRLGRTDYALAWSAMRARTDARDDDSPDELWLTEHASIYTLGLAGRREHLLRDSGIPVVAVDRGGQVTWHGPGQLVVYVLVDLARGRLGVRELVRRLEGAVVTWLGGLGLDARGRIDAPGVYVTRDAGGTSVEAKIAAIGLKVRQGRTYHGIAVNIDPDLAPFADIDPCGFPGLAVTSLRELGIAMSVDRAGAALAPVLAATIRQP